MRACVFVCVPVSVYTFMRACVSENRTSQLDVQMRQCMRIVHEGQ